MTWAVLASLAGFVVAAAWMAWADDLANRVGYLHWVAVGTAAVAGALLDAAPTGHTAWDGALRAGSAAALAAAGLACPPMVVALVATALGATCLLAPSVPQPAASALGMALGVSIAQLLTSRSRLLGAVAGAGVAIGAMGLAWPAGDGGPTLVGGAAASVLLAAGWASAGRRGRRIGLGMAAAGAVALVGSIVVGGSALLPLRDGVEEATDAIEEGLDLAATGQRPEAIAAFDRARISLEEISATLSGPRARLLAALPVAAQNLDALQQVTDLGLGLTEQASRAMASAEPERFRGSDGRIVMSELDTIVAEVAATDELVKSSRLQLTELDSPWLVGPLTDRLAELDAELADAEPSLERAQAFTSILPGLLGGEGARRYFLAVMTPSELRGSIGIIGNYGEIQAFEGLITLPVRGRDTDLNRNGLPWEERTLVAPEDYLERYGDLNPARFWQEVPASPDFPTVADVIANLYPQSGGREVDGVIAVDPIALAAILTLTGPVEVQGWHEPLTASNAQEILLFEQYVAYEDRHGDRVKFLNEATRVIFERLVALDADPARLAEVLGELVRERHVLFQSFDAHEAEVLGELDGNGAFPSAADGDVLAVVSHNRGGSKIDWFLRRRITAQVSVDDQGQVRSTVTVRMANRAPASGLPPYIIGGVSFAPEAYGTNQQFLSIYTPHTLASATLNGAPLEMVAERELGMQVYTSLVEIPPGGEVTLVAQFEGVTGPDYSLEVFRQTTVVPDRTRVELTVPTTWQVRGGPKTPNATAEGSAVAFEDEQRVAWKVSAGPA